MQELLNKLRIPPMHNLSRTILADTGFWIALYDPSDDHYEEARGKVDFLERSTVLVPWPTLYETFRSQFTKWADRVKGFESFLRGPNAQLVDDAPYREEALSMVFGHLDKRCFSLVDTVIRLLLENRTLHTKGLLTTDPGDFHDLCRKHGIELL